VYIQFIPGGNIYGYYSLVLDYKSHSGSKLITNITQTALRVKTDSKLVIGFRHDKLPSFKSIFSALFPNNISIYAYFTADLMCKTVLRGGTNIPLTDVPILAKPINRFIDTA